MQTTGGLRERKKQQTKQQIAEAAQRLFVERGFEAVTVAEVAAAADVSPGTVFNYFPTKEQLFYGQMESFEAGLVRAVKERPAGEPVISAFRTAALEGSGRLAGEEVGDMVAQAAAVVAGSPSLQAREREIVAQVTDELARVLAAETGAGDVESWAAANALMGVQRALVAQVREQVSAGVRGKKLASLVEREGGRAFDLLERGLAGFGGGKSA